MWTWNPKYQEILHSMQCNRSNVCCISKSSHENENCLLVTHQQSMLQSNVKSISLLKNLSAHCEININQNKNLFSWKKLKFVKDWTFGRKLRVVRGSGSSWSWRCWSFCSSFWGVWSRRCWSFGCCSIAATRNTNSELKSNTDQSWNQILNGVASSVVGYY